MRLADQLRQEPTFNKYQELTGNTATYPRQSSFNGVTYCCLKLAGEAGEVAEKLGKLIRDNEAWGTNPLDWPEEVKLGFKKEIGDCSWYLAALCREFGFTFQDVAETNLEKLESRKERGTLSGSGDNR